MRTLNLTLATAVASMVVLVGCEDKKVANATAAAVDKTKAAAGSVSDAAKSTGAAVKDAAKDAGNKAADMAGKAADATKDAANKAADATKDAANKAADATKSAASSATATAGDWMDAAKAKFDSAGGASAGVTKFVDGAKAQLATLKTKVDAASPAVKSAVAPMMTEIDKQVATLTTKATELKTATPETWKSIVDGAKPAMDKISELVKAVNTKLAG